VARAFAWLFPGQGTQAVGMGRDLYDRSPAARRVLDLAEATLGFPLTRLLFEGPEAELQATVNAQPAIVAVSLAALAALREAWEAVQAEPLPQPAYVAGHSVGEYAALVASWAASAETGLRLVRERASLMHQAGQQRPGGMMAVLGLDRAAVEAACEVARGEVPGSYVGVANHNAPTQAIIAGDAAGLAAAQRACTAAGARRCIPLPVSAAFHSAAMLPAAGPLALALAQAPISDAQVPLMANVDARPLTGADDLRRELAEQVVRPVHWADSLQRMIEGGVTVFVELGASKVLTGLVERLEGALEARAVGDAAGAEAAVPWLAALGPFNPVGQAAP
jgi:[acyl-carrier-protein] S-malonyltransferase